jgi:hypothetical protein
MVANTKVLLRSAILLLLGSILKMTVAAQTTWYVNVIDGDDLFNTGLSPTVPKKTIGAAISAASSGDFISVAYGASILYNENATFNKKLTVTSTGGTPTVSGITINNSLAAPNNTVTFTGPFRINSALTLTNGQVNGANLITMAPNTTIIRDLGGVSASPTLAGSLDVTYLGSGSYPTGPELPTAAGALRTLTINKAAGTITLGTSATVNSALVLTGGTLSLAQPLVMSNGTSITRDAGVLSGVPAFSGSVNVTYAGSSSYSTGSELPTSTSALNNLTISKSGGTITLSAAVTVNGTLSLGVNNIATGSNTLTVLGSVTHTSGYVVGNLRKRVPTGASSPTFEIGDAGNYAPVSLAFSSVSTAGYLTVNTTGSAHPYIANSGISNTKYVNRFWTLTNSGIALAGTYNATFNFQSGDLTGGAVPGNFIAAQYSAGTWTRPTVGSKTATSTQASGLTSFGDFAVGEPQTAVPAAPTNLTATAASSSQIDLSWADNSTNEDGFKIERAPGGTTSFVEIVTVGPNTTGYQNTGLSPSANYSYRVRAYNVGGYSGYSNTVTVSTLGADTQPPTIAIQTPSMPTAGQQVQITATISDASGVQSATLWYRIAGSQTFTAGPMSGSAGQYLAVVPSAAVTAAGLEYYVEATDTRGNRTREPATGFRYLSVSVAGQGVVCPTAQPGGDQQSAYRLISLPIDATSKSPQAVLEHHFGSYDPTNWRFFEFTADQSYREFTSSIVMSPGKAFWLLAKKGGTFDTGPGVSVPTSSEFSLPLNAGWTLVGNPFNFSIPVSKLRLANGASVQLRSFTGSWNNPQSSPVTAIEPFCGYAFASQGVTTLLVNPVLTPAPKLHERLSETGHQEIQWSITIYARCQGAVDADNVALVSQSALEGLDPIDSPEPPVIGEYVSVYFNHPEWGGVLRKYSIDARPVPDQREAWRFEVSSDIQDVVSLEFGGLQSVPTQYDVVLVDELLKTTLDLRTRERCAFAATGNGIARSFTLLVGTPESVRQELTRAAPLPRALELMQNFPNPFNPITTISYSLPRASHIILRVYDVAGREVATLADEDQSAGRHAVLFDGRTHASGTYYCRMHASALDGSDQSFLEVKRLVLVK